jgi:putative component of toxin-antitoxin plasmid stabilization module
VAHATHGDAQAAGDGVGRLRVELLGRSRFYSIQEKDCSNLQA